MKSILAILAIAALAFPASASAADWETTTFPFTDAIYNTCNDEVVIVNGSYTISTRITTRANGFLRYEVRERKFGTGQSDKGFNYTFSSYAGDDMRIRPERYVRRTVGSLMELQKVGTTGESLWVMAFDTLLTDTQTGETIVEKSEYKTVCG
jgi:hypothetical protein